MKKLYVIPQSRIELAKTPDLMVDDFLGIASASNGGSVYCPPASEGA